MNLRARNQHVTRHRLFVVAAVATAVRVFLACGSSDLTESDSCRRRGGSCASVSPGETADCRPGLILYLDSCYCCAPPDDASTVTPTFGTDSGDMTTNDAAMADDGGDAAETDGETDGSSNTDGSNDAADADSGLDARADG